MREILTDVRSRNAVSWACVALIIVGVAWAWAYTAAHTTPRYATGIGFMGRPWCVSYDDRQCPSFTPGYGISAPPRVVVLAEPTPAP